MDQEENKEDNAATQEDEAEYVHVKIKSRYPKKLPSDYIQQDDLDKEIIPKKVSNIEMYNTVKVDKGISQPYGTLDSEAQQQSSLGNIHQSDTITSNKVNNADATRMYGTNTTEDLYDE